MGDYTGRYAVSVQSHPAKLTQPLYLKVGAHHGEHRARAYSGNLEAESPVGSRNISGQGIRGQSPLKLKHLAFARAPLPRDSALQSMSLPTN